MREAHSAPPGDFQRASSERNASELNSASAQRATRRSPRRARRRDLDADFERTIARTRRERRLRHPRCGLGCRRSRRADFAQLRRLDRRRLRDLLCRLRGRADLSHAGARSYRLHPRAFRRAAALRRLGCDRAASSRVGCGTAARRRVRVERSRRNRCL